MALAGPLLLGGAAASRASPVPTEASPPAPVEAPISTNPTNPTNPAAPSALPSVVVAAPEPRYVAPTRRDRIGRIWAPVFIDGKGPFRLALDSGATTSGISTHVARVLGLPIDGAHQVMLRGVVGLRAVPLVHVDSLTVGDLSYGNRQLPVLADPLGGADGILSTDGMADERIFIDFHHDLIRISRSREQPAPLGFITIPFDLVGGHLVVAQASIGNVRTRAVIDTGGQVTIANLALRRALLAQRAALNSQPDRIEDVTQASQVGDRLDSPPIFLGTGLSDGTVKISNSRLTFGDMHIFEHLNLTREPTVLIGMDALGLLDTVVIDYRLRQLQVRLSDAD